MMTDLDRPVDPVLVGLRLSSLRGSFEGCLGVIDEVAGEVSAMVREHKVEPSDRVLDLIGSLLEYQEEVEARLEELALASGLVLEDDQPSDVVELAEASNSDRLEV